MGLPVRGNSGLTAPAAPQQTLGVFGAGLCQLCQPSCLARGSTLRMSVADPHPKIGSRKGLHVTEGP